VRALDSVPSYTARFENPAIAVSTRFANTPALRIPTGLIGLAHPERNPLLYVTDKKRFRSIFDGLAAAAQLARPYRYLINPPRSPDRVVAQVDAGGLRITNGTGTQLLSGFTDRRGSPYVTLYRTPPLFQFAFRTGAFQLTSSAHGGGTGVSVAPNDPLETLLTGGAVPGTPDLAVEFSTSGGVGIEQRVTGYVILPGRSLSSGLVFAGRLAGHYTAGLADLAGTLRVATDDPATEVTYRGRLLYPGNGYSLGGRLDLGLLLKRRGWYGGVGLLSVAAADVTAGGRLLGEGERQEVTLGPGPQPGAQLGFDQAGLIALHLEGSLYPSISARATALFRLGAVSLHYSYLFGSHEETTWRIGVPVGVGHLSVALTSERTVFSDNALYGVGLTWSLRSPQRLWRDELTGIGRNNG
jgi:hypothetical protein